MSIGHLTYARLIEAVGVVYATTWPRHSSYKALLQSVGLEIMSTDFDVPINGILLAEFTSVNEATVEWGSYKKQIRTLLLNYGIATIYVDIHPAVKSPLTTFISPTNARTEGTMLFHIFSHLWWTLARAIAPSMYTNTTPAIRASKAGGSNFAAIRRIPLAVYTDFYAELAAAARETTDYNNHCQEWMSNAAELQRAQTIAARRSKNSRATTIGGGTNNNAGNDNRSAQKQSIVPKPIKRKLPAAITYNNILADSESGGGNNISGSFSATTGNCRTTAASARYFMSNLFRRIEKRHLANDHRSDKLSIVLSLVHRHHYPQNNHYHQRRL